MARGRMLGAGPDAGSASSAISTIVGSLRVWCGRAACRLVQVHRIEGGAVTILLGRRTAGVGLDGTLEEPAPADDDVVTNGGMWRSLVHFGAVVAAAPSPLSTPRSAAGQAQLRLGKPLRMKCRASPVLLFMRAGKVVAGTVGIVRATVPFHGEHDALEPTKEGLRCCGCH